MTKYYRLQRWPKGESPIFKAKDIDGNEENSQSVKGTLKGVFFNQDKEVEKRDGTGKVTIPAHLNLTFEEDFNVQINYDLGALFRTIANSLLSVNKGDEVEIYVYNKKFKKADGTLGDTKTATISNPKVQETKKNHKGEEFTANKLYPWAVQFKDVPEVEIIKNKKGEFVSSDDEDANNFFIDKLKEKFIWSSSKNETEELDVDSIPF